LTEVCGEETLAGGVFHVGVLARGCTLGGDRSFTRYAMAHIAVNRD